MTGAGTSRRLAMVIFLFQLYVVGALQAQSSPSAAVHDSIARERQALRHASGDSGLLYLKLARQLFQVGRPAEGRAAAIAAAAGSSPEAQRAFQRELLLAMPGFKGALGRWDSMPVGERSRYYSMFWDECDVERGQPAGYCIKSHYRRLVQANDNFRILRGARAGELDERGLVWVKQGAPEERLVMLGRTRYEIWRYSRPFGHLILYFMSADSLGSAVLFHLVSSIEDAPQQVLMAACRIDVESCTAAPDPVPIAGMFSEPKKLPLGARSILTTVLDSVPRRTVRGDEADRYALQVRYTAAGFTNTMHPNIQALALNDEQGNTPRFVAAMQFALRELQATGLGRHSIFRVHYRISTLNAAGRRRDLDTVLTLAAGLSGTGDSVVLGLLGIDVSGGVETMSVAITQPNGRRMLWVSPAFEFNPGMPLGTSLVLGRSTSGLCWTQDSLALWLNPSRTYYVGDTVHAYIQTANLSEVDTTWGRIVLGDGDTPNAKHRLVVRTVPIAAVAERVGHRFDFALDTLAPGTYHISFGIWWSFAGSKAQSATFRWEVFTVRERSGAKHQGVLSDPGASYGGRRRSAESFRARPPSGVVRPSTLELPGLVAVKFVLG